jgi:D-lyxose ketol-isomerase
MSSETSLSAQDALVALMMAVSLSDESVGTAELVTIEALVNNLPVFANYDADRMQNVSKTVFDLFEEEDGLDAKDSKTSKFFPAFFFN